MFSGVCSSKPYTNEEIQYWVHYKEENYRQYGIDHKRTVLPPGAKEVLDYLKSKNVPVILCTSSIIENVEFYYKYFDLNKTNKANFDAFNRIIRNKIGVTAFSE